ncbi:hypothetical protein AAVH_08327 [Aphelenchoides avenae]|nr:hypothetical protein AAVH_08327 [Aphelenchus avenae]
MKWLAAFCVALTASSALGLVINGFKQKRFYQWEPQSEILNMDQIGRRQRSHIEYITQLRERKSYADLQLMMGRTLVTPKATAEESGE